MTDEYLYIISYSEMSFSLELNDHVIRWMNLIDEKPLVHGVAGYFVCGM
jgi:hypothetical protein